MDLDFYQKPERCAWVNVVNCIGGGVGRQRPQNPVWREKWAGSASHILPDVDTKGVSTLWFFHQVPPVEPHPCGVGRVWLAHLRASPGRLPFRRRKTARSKSRGSIIKENGDNRPKNELSLLHLRRQGPEWISLLETSIHCKKSSHHLGRRTGMPVKMRWCHG